MHAARRIGKDLDYCGLHAIRDITNATNARTLIAARIPQTAVGNTAIILDCGHDGIVASTLLHANLNSLPLDWTARFKIAGVHVNFFLLRQFPILPPEAYLNRIGRRAKTFVEEIVPRMLELTYVSDDMAPYAAALGYDGPPYEWNDTRRHMVQSELDAIYACMYGLERSELEWILDPQEPGVSFPTLKHQETERFGEYKTCRLVLEAYDRVKTV